MKILFSLILFLFLTNQSSGQKKITTQHELFSFIEKITLATDDLTEKEKEILRNELEFLKKASPEIFSLYQRTLDQRRLLFCKTKDLFSLERELRKDIGGTLRIDQDAALIVLTSNRSGSGFYIIIFLERIFVSPHQLFIAFIHELCHIHTYETFGFPSSITQDEKLASLKTIEIIKKSIKISKGKKRKALKEALNKEKEILKSWQKP